MIILYDEDNSHKNALDYIIKTYSDYAYILHDRDYTETGEIKKPHYHVVLKFNNARSLSGLAKELGIKENYISITHKSYKYALKYLIHLDEENKTQYGVEEVKGNLKTELVKIINSGKSEEQFVLQILNSLDSMKCYVSIHKFIEMVCELGLWSYYRRSAYIFQQLLYEHNENYKKLT